MKYMEKEHHYCYFMASQQQVKCGNPRARGARGPDSDPRRGVQGGGRVHNVGYPGRDGSGPPVIERKETV